MPVSLVDLESRRANVQLQIAQLGDMRSGSITGTGGRCGNPNCHCHRAGDPGHGPYYRLTRKVNGKTVTETFSSAASLTKAQREVISLRFAGGLSITEAAKTMRKSEGAIKALQHSAILSLRKTLLAGEYGGK